MFELSKLETELYQQLNLVNDVLERYTSDEAGETEKYKFYAMSDLEKIKLLTYTLMNCSDWCDFETDLIINFDYCVYMRD